MKIKTLLYPIGSTVIHKGMVMLIQKISVCVGDGAAEYSIVGTDALGSKSFGRAWIAHDELELHREADIASWQLLQNLGGV